MGNGTNFIYILITSLIFIIHLHPLLIPPKYMLQISNAYSPNNRKKISKILSPHKKNVKKRTRQACNYNLKWQQGFHMNTSSSSNIRKLQPGCINIEKQDNLKKKSTKQTHIFRPKYTDSLPWHVSFSVYDFISQI